MAADPATPVAFVASSGIYGTAVAVGIPEQLALPVALAAAVGAAMALSHRGRIKVGAWEIGSAVVMYAFAWCLGALGGPAAFSVMVGWFPVLAGLPRGAVLPLLALLLAAYGQSHIVPLLEKIRPTPHGGPDA